MLHETSRHFNDFSICPFSKSIVLWHVWWQDGVNDPFLLENIAKLSVAELASAVGHNLFDLLPSLLLVLGLELQDCFCCS